MFINGLSRMREALHLAGEAGPSTPALVLVFSFSNMAGRLAWGYLSDCRPGNRPAVLLLTTLLSCC